MSNFTKIAIIKQTIEKPRQEEFSMHLHDDCEILCFLSGDAKYIVEGSVYPLHRGDIIIIARSESHRLLLRSDKPYSRIVMNFTPKNADAPLLKKLMRPFNEKEFGSLNRYPASLFTDSAAIDYLERIILSEPQELKDAYLTVLLNELSEQFLILKENAKAPEANVCADVLQYLNRHLTETLSLELLSKRFFISKSQLNRNFKRVMGSTVWEYITEKRLLLAKSLIENGEHPTKIYIDCGFSDYSVFYRAYRTKFHSSPSSIHNS